MKLVFATNNAHKLEEIKEMLGSQHEIVSLKEIQCHEDIPEEQDTLEGNALQKARYIHEKYGLDCFADDTGLEIKALNNAPGVYSARYAGNAHDSEANMKKVLQKMQNIPERQARFRTVIALILGEKEYLFEGIVNGEILTSKHGHEGFGYDPIFRPEGFQESFAEMPLREKRNQSPGTSRPRIMPFFKQLVKNMHTVKAIILKSIPHSEQQQILHVYSKERGYMQMITPLALFKRKANTSAQCMQIVEIEFIPNERGGLHKLKSLSPLANTSSIYFDVYKMNIVLLWGEILNLVLRDSEPNPDLYEYIQTSVEYLNITRDDIANFNLLFLFRLSKLLGFSIDNSTYLPDHVFNINDGCFYPTGSPGNYYTGPHSAKAIHTLCTCQLQELKNIPLNQQGRKILLDIVLLFLGFHLNLDFNTKSIRVIREIFS